MSGPDILREVEESIRAEKAAQFWKKNGHTILAIVFLAILGTAAQSFWVSYKKNQSEAATSQFLEAFDNKSPLSALQKLGQEEKGSASALAGLSTAAMAIEQKDWPAAISAYKNITTNKSVDKIYKDLALIQMISIQIDHDTKANADDLLNAISPLLSDKKSPWYANAVFISSLIKSSKKNDLKAAQADLDILLSMNNLPAGFLEQVNALSEMNKLKMGSK